MVGSFTEFCINLLMQEMCQANPASGACTQQPPNSCGADDDGQSVPCEI